MRILVVGGFGFVGGRLAEHFSARGHQVLIGSRNPLAHHDHFHDLEVKKVEWNNESTLFQICKGIDVVIHCAGMNAKECLENPAGALEFNGNGTNRLANAASNAGVDKFIFLSTAHVYASPLAGFINESTETSNPHPYATSHVAGENALRDIGRLAEMKIIVVRLSNAFGAPIHRSANCWSLLVNDLCKQVVLHKKMVFTSDGRQLRDFISLQEVCRVIEKIMVIKKKQKNIQIFNLGSGVTKSVHEMAMLVQERAKRVLGFEPSLYFSKKQDNQTC